MADENKRTITDIILSLEERVKKIEGIVQNDDMLLKQFWNVLIPKLDELRGALNQPAAPAPTKPTRSGLSVEAVDEPMSKEHKTTPAIKKAIKKTVDKPALGSVEITQLVQYPDGKRVLYAIVKIFNANGDCINSTKTNTAGRWMAHLIPGNYKVQITKPNPPLNLDYKIEVRPSDTSVELNSVGA